MKVGITVISIMLMVPGCYCAVVSYNNFTGNDNNNNVNVDNTLQVVNGSVRSSTTDVAQPRKSSSSSNSSTDGEDENLLQNIIQCIRADSLFKCFKDRVGSLIRVWREALLNSVRRDGGNNGVNSSQDLENMLRVLRKAVYHTVSSFFTSKDEDEARSGSDDADPSDTSLEPRGKKKKVHKEIKKIIIKIIIAIALFLLKIKMLLGMLQSIIISKFILAATVLLATKTFKIWYEIKQAKHHKEHDKSVIYYDNVHDHHSYELPEHEYSGSEESHGYSPSGWGSLWGRSYTPTQIPAITSTPAFQSAYRRPWPYYIRPKVEPPADADEFS